MTFYERFLEISGRVEDFVMESLFGVIIFSIGLIVGVVLLVFGLSWIFADKTDHGQCLQSHRETYVSYMYVNKVMMPMTNYRNVCDVWEYPAVVENE